MSKAISGEASSLTDSFWSFESTTRPLQTFSASLLRISTWHWNQSFPILDHDSCHSCQCKLPWRQTVEWTSSSVFVKQTIWNSRNTRPLLFKFSVPFFQGTTGYPVHISFFFFGLQGFNELRAKEDENLESHALVIVWHSHFVVSTRLFDYKILVAPLHNVKPLFSLTL